MAKLYRCDNKRCEKEIPELATYHTLQMEVPTGPMLQDDIREKQFCCLGCVAEYAADACGLVVNRA